MSFGHRNRNPITPDFPQFQQQFQQYTSQKSRKFDNVVDGLPHVCADGHKHASVKEVGQCIDAHKVYVCCTNHMHTETSDAERCDTITREEQQFRDKELARKHEREMMDKQIKIVENLRAMGWDFRRNGMPSLPWKDC